MMFDVVNMTKEQVARHIDQAYVLDVACTTKEIDEYIDQTVKYKFGAICLLPYHTPYVAERIGDFCKENDIKISAALSFPFGQCLTSVKMFEAKEMIKAGATQLDMACNVSLIKEKKFDEYKYELEEFAKICDDADILSKAIIQVNHMTDEEIALATRMVIEAGVGQVKTSTGLNVGLRPDFHDLEIIKGVFDEMKPEKTKLKFCTGSLLELYGYIEAGCTSIGTSLGVEACEKLDLYKSWIRKSQA